MHNTSTNRRQPGPLRAGCSLHRAGPDDMDRESMGLLSLAAIGMIGPCDDAKGSRVELQEPVLRGFGWVNMGGCNALHAKGPLCIATQQ